MAPEVPISQPMLTRENIRSGAVRSMLKRIDRSLQFLSDNELDESRQTFLESREPDSDVWLFGYGSLIWNPAFHYSEMRIGIAHGYHRKFCLWSQIGRGTKERPGLMLGLERGGSCRGVAYRILAEKVETELDIIWHREMLSNAYVPRWVKVRTAEGDVQGILFAINRKHPRYTGPLGNDIVVRTIAAASGPLGPCAEYLMHTVSHLKELGIEDRRLSRLHDDVTALRGVSVAT